MFLEAGSEITGAVYADLTKTVIGTYISVEFYRKEVSTLMKHGKNKVKHVLLKKLRLGHWDGYMKPGSYKLPFGFRTSPEMIPSSDTAEQHLWHQPQPQDGKRDKLIQYTIKLRFPGDSAQRAKAVQEFDVFLAPSCHPTLPSLA